MPIAFTGQGVLWAVFAVVVASVIALDLGVFQKTPAEPTPRRALAWTGLWITLAGLFGLGVWWQLGSAKGTQFFAAYLLEKALSIDNLFVLLLVFAQFRVPRASQRKVLMGGVLGAVVLRALFIVCGASLVTRFHFVTYAMGAFLLYAAGKLVLSREEEAQGEPPPEGLAVRLLRKVIPVQPELEGGRFFSKTSGRWRATPLVLALVAVETADIVFALDSIPAVFGVTTDSFIALTSNLFAILGLRSLYFLLADLLERLRYLKAGLAGVLGFVGLKMTFAFLGEISAATSLIVIVSILGAATLASLRADQLSAYSKGEHRC